jgi:hypothetical protein
VFRDYPGTYRAAGTFYFTSGRRGRATRLDPVHPPEEDYTRCGENLAGKSGAAGTFPGIEVPTHCVAEGGIVTRTPCVMKPHHKVAITRSVMKPHHAERDDYFLCCRGNTSAARCGG